MLRRFLSPIISIDLLHLYLQYLYGVVRSAMAFSYSGSGGGWHKSASHPELQHLGFQLPYYLKHDQASSSGSNTKSLCWAEKATKFVAAPC
mmetsp:Transcript_68156/g.149746  ORF Transcript_68156/g.149746 Transcript_68156/m.149746 type:complete len:91 (+) Transcript_68156:787-1059(+)